MEFKIYIINGIEFISLIDLTEDLSPNIILPLSIKKGYRFTFTLHPINDCIQFINECDKNFKMVFKVPYHIYMVLDRLEYLKKTFPNIKIAIDGVKRPYHKKINIYPNTSLSTHMD